MKSFSNIIITFTMLASAVYAAELPKEAKEILEKLDKYEERELKEVEEEIVKKKKSVLRSLERSERRIKSDHIKKLYAWQIENLKKEISASERVIEHDPSKDIVKFNEVYHYDHPMNEFSDQKGELVFFATGKVNLKHKNSNGETLFQHVIDWETKNGALIILDKIHGNIEVAQKRRNSTDELYLKWTSLRKTITARAK